LPISPPAVGTSVTPDAIRRSKVPSGFFLSLVFS
jgi:hypothetical protein